MMEFLRSRAFEKRDIRLTLKNPKGGTFLRNLGNCDPILSGVTLSGMVHALMEYQRPGA